MDSVFLLSILIIFFGAFVASGFKRRRLDRVLKDLRGFQTTIRMENKSAWGRLQLYPNAVELVFNQPYENRRGNTLASYILYAPELTRVNTVLRFHDDLTPENQARRLREIEKTAHPGPLRRFNRYLRNFLASFRDAIDESFGMLLSRAQSLSSTLLTPDNQSRLKKIGATTLGVVSNTAYDPVMEHYLTRRVVAELRPAEDSVIEYTGILKEYSSQWFAVLDCEIEEQVDLPLDDSERLRIQRNLDFEIRLERRGDAVAMQIGVSNHGRHPVMLAAIEDGENFSFEIDRQLPPGETRTVEIDRLPESVLDGIDLDALPIEISLIAPERGNGVETPPTATSLPPLILSYQSLKTADVYLPRNKATLRHAGEFVDQGI